MIHLAREAYEQLPVGVRQLAGTVVRALPVGIRYGRAFAEESKMLDCVDSGSKSAAEIADSRFRRLAEALDRTPFWAEILGSAGLRAASLTREDISVLPLLTKDAVREHLGEMIDPFCSVSARKYVTTGGSTGAPLGLWIEKDASARDWAHVVNAWRRVGYRLDEKRVVLRGLRLGPSSTARSLFEYEPLRRELYVSVFDLDETHLPAIRKRIRTFGARFIHGYPSAMELLGKSYIESGERPPVLKALFAVSENLYPGQRELLEGLFGAPVLSIYGMSERVAFASECGSSPGYHVHEEYGLIELVDASGAVIEVPGVQGEIVATGLISTAVPLLRYRTGDYAQWSRQGVCQCGCTRKKLVELRGRWDREFLVSASGSHIYMTAMNLHSRVFDGVRRFRFVQDRPGCAELQVVAEPGFTVSDEMALLNEVSSKLAGQVDVAIRRVQTIPLTARGKGQFIEQRTQE